MVNIRWVIGVLFMAAVSCAPNNKSSEWLSWCEATHLSDSVHSIRDVQSMRESFVEAFNDQLLHRLKEEKFDALHYEALIDEHRLGLSVVGDTLYQRFNAQMDQPYTVITYPFQTDSSSLNMLESCFYATVDHLFASWVIEQEQGNYRIQTDYLSRPSD